MSRKEYKLPNGKVAVFEYDIFGIGKITLECMDELMGMIADRPQGEWIRISSLYSLDRTYRCSVCGKVIDDMPMDEYYDPAYKGCPYCFTRMKGADDE